MLETSEKSSEEKIINGKKYEEEKYELNSRVLYFKWVPEKETKKKVIYVHDIHKDRVIQNETS
jgi:hypothetical protein